MGFMQSPGAGLGILAAAVVGFPTIIVLAFRWWPETKMGKRVLLAAPKAEDVLPDDADRRHLKGLVGHVGRAKCPMFPGGSSPSTAAPSMRSAKAWPLRPASRSA